ncbi:Premnaspirodiene oxygenase protein [Dioscorea alata]|uniref:Premnaspirodiene oxygenase protein n=1 Tax=Dioscorea alata TaxID=55571 RepID=A0ACB7USR7_DIOAL|nr:Premnaspirodiene oxygenase protein [Dioscorea alata]
MAHQLLSSVNLSLDNFLIWLAPLLLLLLSIKLVLSKRSSRLPPSPWKLPIIGNLHQLGLLSHHAFYNLSKKHGPLMFLKLGQIPTLVVSSSEMAKEIMKTHDLIFASRPVLKATRILLYGNHDLAFAPYGEYWKQVRKIMVANVLSMRRVQLFHDGRKDEVLHLINKIVSHASSHPLKPLNMSRVMFSYTNDLICRAVFGEVPRHQEGRNEIFMEMIEENITLLRLFHLEDFFPSLRWLDSLLGLDERVKKNFKKWDDALSQMVEEHKKKKNDGTDKDDDFVDVLLSFKNDPNLGFSLTDEHVKALLVDMFVAGTDTTYIAFEWSIAELVRNPDVMKKLQNEINGIASGKSMVDEDDLNEMHYLKAFIKEVLRLHPPVPLLLPRESMENCQIGGYNIPNKSRVLINCWAIARDPKVWDKPNEFIPERFLNNSTDFKGQDFEYIPFGSGRRICPGMGFSVAAIELTLANLIFRFEWKLPNDEIGGVDMTEALGVTSRMLKNLYLLPKPYF